MKQRFLTFIFLFALLGGASAQKLTVESFAAAPMDLSASTHLRLDLNKQPCALVKVQLAAADAQFDGNVLGDCEYKAGEYWVYMSQGSYQLKIRHPNFVPLTVNFRDYDIRGVESKVTYVLTLLIPQTGQVVDDGMRYLAMTVEPKDATVMIDEKLQTPNNGQVKIRLSKGVHQYIVMASGYATKKGNVTLDEGTARLDVKLESVKASLTVNCATSGAEVYINGEHKGKTPLKEILPANNYEIEVRLAGYRSNKQSISLSESESRTIDVPALQAITGNLDVNYDPIDAEVWLDGKQLGTSPAIFRNVLVGRHEVELRASGYTTKKEQIEIKEGQTTAVSGKLEASAVGQAVASGSGVSGMDNGHEWVDLGLSICWATTNVGASKPDEYGDYYAWGETSTKSEYSWSTYQYCKGSEKSMTKYCTKSNYGTVDNKTVLDSSDDVAHVKWGGNWRMPTCDELKELKEKCKWTWEERDSHQGYKVTGPNGNSIFLPAAGCRNNSSLKFAGSNGGYWSRSLNESNPNGAWSLFFYSSYFSTDYSNRYYGFSVRPVRLSE